MRRVQDTLALQDSFAKSPVQMMNNPEIPSSSMDRWLAFVRMFDMDIFPVTGTDHVLVDGLSRAEFEGEDVPDDECSLVGYEEPTSVKPETQNSNEGYLRVRSGSVNVVGSFCQQFEIMFARLMS